MPHHSLLSAASAPAPSAAPVAWRSVITISLAALGLYALMRVLPTGTNLNHIDFRVEGKGAVELCDPSNPQFIPVVAMRSPVSVALATSAPAVAGQSVDLRLTLTTSTGKPVGPEDLLIAHTQKLHLLIIDDTLTDYHHVHPVPGDERGVWTCGFTPHRGGVYRVFADFMPAATARGLYAGADLSVAEAGPAAPTVSPATATPAWSAEREGFRFAVEPPAAGVKAGETADLAFTVEAIAGGRVGLEPVMGAFAHLVAFDAARSGFAHLHPAEIDLSQPPDAVRPRLNFKITIPEPGRYMLWAQVSIDGRERFVPFWFDVR